MRFEAWGADWFSFRVNGDNTRRFINLAAVKGIPVANIRWEQTGISARAFGVDYKALLQTASESGCRFEVLERCGPGRRIESLLARPGLPVGAAIFFLLLQVLGGLVWTIDFGVMEEEQRSVIRTLLADCGIHEGVWLDDDTLHAAQTAALQQSDCFGWISLNFAGGCLYIENTDAEYQTIQEKAPQTPLYAKEGGEIVAVEAESGFPVVEIGQSVEAGQLLVDVVRLDRSGNPVTQGAAGRIVARIQKSYTALQPYRKTVVMINGESSVKRLWYLSGCILEQGEPPDVQAIEQEEWIPLHLGRLSLPGCIRQTTFWYQQEETLSYESDQAQALARRDCRAQLYAEFPDAVIESESVTGTSTPEGEFCTILYQFCADIATGES